ncbi:MAG: hypothetical protein IH987_01635, partial [Planctomycetes bacterium]|nr:hypothetical protein [Planctomycetota bacterium]
MTASEQRHDTAWDAFFDFLAEEVVEMNEDEIRSELRSHRINVGPTVDRIKLGLQAAKARQAMQEAPARRIHLLEKLRHLKIESVEDARRDLRAFLKSLGPEPIHELYFNRLESAATDEDIRSLIED